MKELLRYCVLIATCGCLGSGATAENTDTFPLMRVDAFPVPATISDGSGGSTTVTQGHITIYGSSVDFRYEIDLSNGKSLSGVKSRLNDLRDSAGGVWMTADLVSVGGPSGPHNYMFQSSDLKACVCGRLCATPCITDRLADTVRTALLPSSESARLAEYRARLERHQ